MKSSTPKDLPFDVMSAGSFLIPCLGRAVTANLPRPSGFRSQLPINLRRVCGLISRCLGLEDAQSTVTGLVLRLFSERRMAWLQLPFIFLFLLLRILSCCCFCEKVFAVPLRKSASDGLAFPDCLGPSESQSEGCFCHKESFFQAEEGDAWGFYIHSLSISGSSFSQGFVH